MADHESSDGECEGIELDEGLRIADLKEDGVVFKVNTNVDEALEESNTRYFDEEILNNLNSECLGGGSDDEGDRHLMPFEKIALKMVDVTDDGKLKKKVIRKGVGTEPSEGSMVYYHYNGYLEYSDEPYDSTYLRGRPVRDLLGRERFIIGLDKALATMKRGEISEFLIDPDLAFGKMGCPPRIPRDARILMRVELLKFLETPEDVEPCESEIGKQVKTFQQQYKNAEACHVLGNEFFKKKDVNSAAIKYKKAITTLQRMRLADENEQEQQQKLLFKCYVNLAICYNAQKKHPRACQFCRLVLDVNPTHTKALFHYARALVGLGDYKEARKYLLRAHAQNRTNPEVNRELALLDTKISKYNADMTDISRKMFAMPTVGKANYQGSQKHDKNGMNFEAEARACLATFLQDASMKELPLPEGLTVEEEAIFQQEAERVNLLWKTSVLNGFKKTFIVKGT